MTKYVSVKLNEYEWETISACLRKESNATSNMIQSVTLEVLADWIDQKVEASA